MLTEQIDYFIERGLTFVPVNDKKISLIEWKQLQKRMPKKSELDYALNKRAKDLFGFAIITGKYNGFIVLDVDVKKGDGHESLPGDIPDTVTASTRSGGRHYYFKYPKQLNYVPSLTGLFDNVDLRGDGGYVVSPLTEGYSWIHSFDDIEMAECPTWLLEAIELKNKRIEKQNKKRKKELKKRKKYLSSIKTGIKFVDVPKELKSDYLKSFNKDEDYIQRCCELLGLPLLPIGKNFHCIFPSDTEDIHPSANFYRMSDGNIMYCSWRQNTENRYYSMAEVYASIMYGETKHLTGPEHAVWQIRLLVELGYIKPYNVPNVRELPPTLINDDNVVKLYEGFKYLLACKWLYEPNKATAFSYRFASAWCGMGKRQVEIAFKKLLAFNIIECIGKEGKGTNAVNVYQFCQP